jgi:hypothetical protein
MPIARSNLAEDSWPETQTGTLIGSSKRGSGSSIRTTDARVVHHDVGIEGASPC